MIFDRSTPEHSSGSKFKQKNNNIPAYHLLILVINTNKVPAKNVCFFFRV